MQLPGNILKIVYNIYALIVFIALMLVTCPFIIVASAFGIRGGNAVYMFCRLWAIIWYTFIGIRHKEIYEFPHNKNNYYIFIGNHSSYMDIPAAVLSIHQPVRILGKYEMVKYPVFGWIYRAAAILVDRRNAEQRAKSVRALKAALKRKISVFIFPEGTFNETTHPLKDFYNGAFRIAIETQTPIKPLLIIDTLERMHYSGLLTLTPGISRIVYLQEIDVSGYTINDLAELKEKVYKIMEEGLKRYRTYPNA